MTEKFANKISTTVASAYTAGSGTLEVADATGMPASGTFRLRLGNGAGSILRVDSRAGTTLTVTPEEDDGNADVGDSVKLVNTAGAMLQLKADASVGGSIPGWPNPLVPVVAADWSWLNQGGASEVVAGGIAYMTAPTGVGNNFRIRLRSAPATPYTLTALFKAYLRRIDFNSAGLLFRESGTGKIMVFHMLGSATVPAIYVSNSTGVTNITTNRLTWAIWDIQEWFMQINADGTNVKFRFSVDGTNFQELFSQGKGVDFTTAPDQIGYFLNNNGTGADVVMSVLHAALT